MRCLHRLSSVINATGAETKSWNWETKHCHTFIFSWHVSFVTCSLTPCLFGLSVYQSVDTADAHSVCPRHTLHLWKTASVYSGWYYTHRRTQTHAHKLRKRAWHRKTDNLLLQISALHCSAPCFLADADMRAQLSQVWRGTGSLRLFSRSLAVQFSASNYQSASNETAAHETSGDGKKTFRPIPTVEKTPWSTVTEV